MRRFRLRMALLGLVICTTPRMALAGMPSVTLTDFARLRLDAISFFLMVFLLCAWGVKGLWNSFRTEFPKLPPQKPARDVGTPTREDKLRLLGAELLRYAIRHEGRFPSERDARELIATEFWQLPEMPATKYLYLEDRNAEIDSLLAWEPAVFGGMPLGLFTSGEVRAVSRDEIQAARNGQQVSVTLSDAGRESQP